MVPHAFQKSETLRPSSVAFRDFASEPSTRSRATVTDHKDTTSRVRRATAEREPELALVCLLAHEAPRLIEFEHIAGLCLAEDLS